MGVRNLVLVLGDQLDRKSAAFDGFDPERDAVWMAEVEEEATHVRCHKLRIAVFFSAMRQVIDHGYAHHIQRLMVLGLLAQLLGVHPYRFHAWHMAMYLDAIDWVSTATTAFATSRRRTRSRT